MKVVSYTHIMSVSALALSAVPQAAFAQSQSQSPATGAAAVPESVDASNADIIVTANKRAQSVNDVPMSITAVSGDALVQAGIRDASDLARVAPGYTFTKTHDAIPVLSIRGIGYYDNNIGATPAVSVYVDEVQLPYPVMTGGALLDLERVEVLKGPQGTLFGQNSTGGALNFIAAKPRDQFEGQMSLGYGRFNALEAGGYVTGPVSDTLKVRLSAKYERGSPWQYSYTRHDTNGSVDRGAGRILVDWEPSAALSMELTLEGWYDKSEAQAGQLVGLAVQFPGCQNPALATGGALFCFGPPTPFNQVYPDAPHNPRAADWSPGIDYRSDNRFYRASLRTDYTLSDVVKLTSITSYQHFDYHTRTDADATSLRIANFSSDASIKAFYQELRLHGEAGHLNWMIGGNYSKDEVRDLALPDFRDWSIPVGNQRIVTDEDVKVIAGFANAELAFGSGFTLQGGARYTEHKQVMTGCPFDSGDGVAAAAFDGLYGGPLFGPGSCLVLNDLDGSFAPVPIVKVPLKEHNVSWRVGLSYQPNRDLLLYANVSKGYKAGAFTLATFQLVSQFKAATQESVLAYEAGFKLGGDKFQINGAAFYYDYRDKQLLAPFDFGSFGFLDKLTNVPKSRVTGVEFQTVLSPIQGFRVSLNGTYIDTKVTSTFIASSPFGGSLDLKGQPFPYTAKYQGTGDVSYKFPIGARLSASLGSSLTFRSKSNARFGGGKLYELNDYALIDLRAGLETSDGKYALEIWGRNITNYYYRVNTTTNADTVFAIAGQPATYGIRVTANF